MPACKEMLWCTLGCVHVWWSGQGLRGWEELMSDDGGAFGVFFCCVCSIRSLQQGVQQRSKQACARTLDGCGVVGGGGTAAPQL